MTGPYSQKALLEIGRVWEGMRERRDVEFCRSELVTRERNGRVVWRTQEYVRSKSMQPLPQPGFTSFDLA